MGKKITLWDFMNYVVAMNTKVRMEVYEDGMRWPVYEAVCDAPTFFHSASSEMESLRKTYKDYYVHGVRANVKQEIVISLYKH